MHPTILAMRIGSSKVRAILGPSSTGMRSGSGARPARQQSFRLRATCNLPSHAFRRKRGPGSDDSEHQVALTELEGDAGTHLTSATADTRQGVRDPKLSL